MNPVAATPLPALTSLRFFAAALIVVGHGASPSYLDYALPPFDVRQAVSFFFVLSGFILTHVYRGTRGSAGWRNFALARFARLWPVHVVTALLAVVTVAPVEGWRSSIIASTNLLLGQSIVPIAAWHYSLNAVSWSLSTEAFFYVAFPILMIAVLQGRRVTLLLPVVLFMAAIAIAVGTARPVEESAPGVTAWGLLYISPVARLLEFTAGIVAYRIAASRTPADRGVGRETLREISILGVTLAGMVAATSLADVVLHSSIAQVSVWVRTAAPFPLFAAAIAIIARHRGLVSRALTARPFVYLGEMSFSLYMVHQLVLRNLFLHVKPWAHELPLTACLAYWGLAIGGAALMYHLIEQPMRHRLRRALTPSTRAALAG